MKVVTKKIKVQALCNLEKVVFPCSGFIEILGMKSPEAYVSWQMFDMKGNNISNVTQQYYLGKQSNTEDKVIEMTIANIKKFRVSRKVIFSDVEISEAETVNS